MMNNEATTPAPRRGRRAGSHGIWTAALATLLWLVFGFFLQGCASAGRSGERITAEVVSEPAGATVVFRGRAMGSAPMNLTLKNFAQALEVTSADETPPVVERRIKVLSDDRIRVILRLDTQPSALARSLGLSRVLVFDYDERATFDLNSATIRGSFEPMLRRQAALLEEYFADLDIYVCGHTDSTGTQEHNMVLSLERAQAVSDFLANEGVDASRLKVQGFGPDFPLADNATHSGRSLNRRTEILLPD